MMICKVLVITVFCVLTVAFPSIDIDSINEEPQDLIIDQLSSTSDQQGSYGVSKTPLEDYTYEDSNTDLYQTMDLMPTTNPNPRVTQDYEFSTDTETVSSSFLE